jgi:hypothetical protein
MIWVKLIIIFLILPWSSNYAITKIIPTTARHSIQLNICDDIRKGLISLGCPREKILSIGHGIKIASDRTGIEGVLIATLIYTESNFRTDAISKRGYRGLMQTPTATEVPLIDICHGADILKNKLKLANGNLFHALTLYKGGKNPEARRQAKRVLVLYQKVKMAVG